MINLILNILQKCKATDIVMLENKDNYIYADCIIIAGGNSTTHIKHIYKSLFIYLKKNLDISVKKMADKNPDWIIVDIDYIVIHIMSKDSRTNYALERLINETDIKIF